MDGRYILTEFDTASGEVKGPNAHKFVHHCGYLVRDRIPISIREWKKKPSASDVSYVSDVDKNILWKAVTDHFMIRADAYPDVSREELEETVKECTMRKMAQLFQNWKKHLYNTYVKTNTRPNFNEKGPISKAAPHWDDFV